MNQPDIDAIMTGKSSKNEQITCPDCHHRFWVQKGELQMEEGAEAILGFK